jgi:Tol biopolymer transport system component
MGSTAALAFAMGVRVVSDGISGFRGPRLTAAFILAFVLALLSRLDARAMCDVIPGVTAEFRGALGTLNRPFAIPGDDGQQISLSLKPSECDSASPGFLDLPGGTVAEDDYFVTLLFKPPNPGARNAIVLTTASNQAVCLASVALAAPLLGGGSGACRLATPATQELKIADPSTLRFRFPDTDADLAPDADDRTYTGPTVIAVTPVSDALPFALATNRCADTPGLVACIDELYARNGICDTNSEYIDPIFGSFAALPPANDYQALCTTAQTECTGLASELRLGVDAAGNVLLPMDWRGVLLRPEGIPVPRLVRGETSYAAFLGGAPVRISGRSFLASYSTGGLRLPPIFEPLADPISPSDLTLFGSVDAPVGVIRIARRMPDLTGDNPVYRQCTGGANTGLPCVLGEECRGGACGATTCRIGGVDTGTPCVNDADCGGGSECGPALFDIRDRLTMGGVGPVVVANTQYTLEAESPVPLEGLIQSPEVFAFVQLEQIAGSSSDGPQPKDLNADGDTTDAVVVLRDRETGVVVPIGELGSEGRAATRIHEPPFSYPAVTAQGNVVAFLEPEPLQGDCSVLANCDQNGDGDVFDTILRVYRINPDCGGGDPCAEELTNGQILVADADPRLDGRNLAISDGLVFFRTSEADAAPRATSVASVTSDGEEAIGQHSQWPAISANGRHVAFFSDTNLGSLYATVYVHDRDADGNDIFDEPAPGISTVAVTVSSAGVPANWASASEPSISADGREVAFASGASNLLPPGVDSNGFNDVFVHDRDADMDGVFDEQGEPGAISTVRVNVSSSGDETNDASYSPVISGDGRHIVFWSYADNLLPPGTDSNAKPDIFVHDRDPDGDGTFDQPGDISTVRVNISSSGTQSDGSAGDYCISEDARFVAFASSDNDLVPNDPSPFSFDPFVHDRDADADGIFDEQDEPGSVSTEIIGVRSWSPLSLSGDGRFAVFSSYANDLVPGDTNDVYDIFVQDRQRQSIERVSLSSEEVQGDGDSVFPVVSRNGRFVAFVSSSGNLVSRGGAPDVYTSFPNEVYVHDRLTGLTDRVSVASDGERPRYLQCFGGENVGLSCQDSGDCPAGSCGFVPCEIADNHPFVDESCRCRVGEEPLGASCTAESDCGPSACPDPDDCPRNCIADTAAIAALEPTISADGQVVAFTLRGGLEVTLVQVSPGAEVWDLVTDVFVRGPDPTALGYDLSGDSALDAVVLRAFDLGTTPAQLVEIGPATEVAIAAGVAAFLMPESATKVDRNGDGDLDDHWVHLFTRTGGVEDLDVEAVSIALSAEVLAALVPTPAGASFVQVRDMLAPAGWTSVGPDARVFDVAGSSVAILAEATDDLYVYDAATATLTSVGQSAEDFVLGDEILAFHTSEASEGGADLNGDGDGDDDVLQVWDLTSGQLMNTGQAVIPCRFEACDPRVPYRVSGDTVTFLTLEADQGGLDLNGDGDATDIVLQSFHARAATAAGGASAFRLAAASIASGPGSNTTLASVTAGICTDTAEACASNDDCTGGTCFVPPGGCIEDLGTSCTCGEEGCSGCSSSEFCVPTGGSQGTCHFDSGPCSSDGDCTGPAVCHDGAQDLLRLFGPLSPQIDGKQIFLSAGLRLEKPEGTGVPCITHTDCGPGEICSEAGSCQEDRRDLISVGAPDTDGDGVSDPFDNCSWRPNPDQVDEDGDGIGNLCDLKPVPEPSRIQLLVSGIVLLLVVRSRRGFA